VSCAFTLGEQHGYMPTETRLLVSIRGRRDEVTGPFDPA
jgi:hypothetical protein